jgi:hypothetical protein
MKAEAPREAEHPARALRTGAGDGVSILAVVYTGLNDTEQAFDWLQKAYMERSGGLLQIKGDLIFDPIRSDRAFQEPAA